MTYPPEKLSASSPLKIRMGIFRIPLGTVEYKYEIYDYLHMDTH